MYRIDFIHSIVMSSALLIAATLAAQSPVPLDAMTGTTTATLAKTTAIDSRDVDTQIMHDVTAGAVIGALKSQFKHRDIELRLGLVESNPANRRDLRVHGTADIRIEGSTAWLPIRFAALYDTATQTAISPTITLVRKQSAIDATTASRHSMTDMRVGRDSCKNGPNPT